MDEPNSLEKKRKTLEPEKELTTHEDVLCWLRTGISGLKRSLEDVDNELQQAREGLRRRRHGNEATACPEGERETPPCLGLPASITSAEVEASPCHGLVAKGRPEIEPPSADSLAEQKLEHQRLQQERWERALAEQARLCTPSKVNAVQMDQDQSKLEEVHQQPAPQCSNSEDPPALSAAEIPPVQPTDQQLHASPTPQQLETHRQRYLRKQQILDERKALSFIAPTDHQQTVHDTRNHRRQRALTNLSEQPPQGTTNSLPPAEPASHPNLGGSPFATEEKTAPESTELEEKQNEESELVSRERAGTEERECRVCRTGEEEGRPLFYPCRCKGSIKYIHQDCLLEWLKVSKQKEKCELCGESFRFTPVYKEGAPPRLSPLQFMACILWNGLHWAPLVLRIVFMTLLWLMVLPVMTMSTGRFFFLSMDDGFPSVEDATGCLPGWSPKQILNDSFYGAGLCMAILTVTTSLVTLLTFEGGDVFMVPPGQQGQNQRNGQRGNENRALAAGPPVQQQPNPPELGQPQEVQEGNPAPIEPVAEDPEPNAPPAANEAANANNNNPPAGAQNVNMDIGQEVEEIFGLDDDINLQELLGLEGSMLDAVLSVVQTFFFNVSFLLVFQMAPFQLGRSIWEAAESRGYMSSFPELFMSVEEDTISTSVVEEDPLGDGNTMDVMTPEEIAAMMQTAQNVAYLGLGYLVLLCGVVAVTALLFSWHAATQAGSGQAPSASLNFIQAVKGGIRGAWSWGKAAANLGVRLFVLPVWVGVLADLFTLKGFAVSPNQRLSMLIEMPLITTGVHWLVGFLFIMAFSIFAIELRKILHRDILRGFLPVAHEEMGEAGALLGNLGLEDLVILGPPPQEPNFVGPAPANNNNAINNNNNLIQNNNNNNNIATLQVVARLVVSFALPVPLLALVLFLPMAFGHLFLPFIGPLKLKFIEPFLEVQLPLELLLFHVALPVAIERLHMRSHCYHMLLAWCRHVGQLVGLKEWLLETHFLQQEQQPQPRGNAAQGEEGAEVQNQVQRLVQREEVQFLWARLCLLSVLAATSITLAATLTIYVPLHAGRTMFSVVGLPVENDFYAYCIGTLASVSFIALIKNVMRSVVAAQEHLHAYSVVIQTVVRWVLIALKWSVLLSFWLVLTPMFIGTLFEVLIVTPLRVPVEEIPNFAPYSNWALGIVFLKIWLRLCLLGAFGDSQWKRNLERILRNGIRGVELWWTLKNVCFPLLNNLGEYLFVPYFLAEGLVPWIIQLPLIWQPYLRRYCFLGYLSAKLLVFLGCQFAKLIAYLHKRLLDDQYLVGVELNNLTSE